MADLGAYEFSMIFKADTSQAKKSIESLQQSINNAINASVNGSNFSLTPQIQEARENAIKLQIALENATNVDTGKLNLNKFQTELNKSHITVQELAKSFQALGPEGVESFRQLTAQIQEADTRLFSLSDSLKKVTDTFANTVRWKASGAALDAITNSISETVKFAQQLDASLNNIRIVTGKTQEQMAKFAQQANQSAKALSTSTTAYTDASLIFYQQGLDDNAVKQRTDTTIKLANVTKESVDTVSSQLTAVWNNFDDGSQSLEHYADAMVKLGAETASSSNEIATGLEKFASVAPTIGLSFEAASASLATITATTRQSADTVGTSLKTLFSRMEQLKLGDTLEDGTSLGDYSKALEKVGVNIKDVDGQLKDMDQIIAETGAKWKSLSRDQQVALSQSVAGIRQYNTFMALMNNYDYYEENVKRAKNSNGELEKQQKIYEDSISASKKRIQASFENIKMEIFDNDDLKKVYTIGEKIVGIVEKIVKSLGGTKGILLLASSVVTKIYQSKIGDVFSRIGFGVKDIGIGIANAGKSVANVFTESGDKFKKGLKTADKMKIKFTEENSQLENPDDGQQVVLKKHQYSEDYQKMQEYYLRNKKNMTEAQREEYENTLKLIKAIEERNLREAEGIDKLNEETIKAEQASTSWASISSEYENEVENETEEIRNELEVQLQNVTLAEANITSQEVNIETANVSINNDNKESENKENENKDENGDKENEEENDNEKVPKTLLESLEEEREALKSKASGYDTILGPKEEELEGKKKRKNIVKVAEENIEELSTKMDNMDPSSKEYQAMSKKKEKYESLVSAQSKKLGNLAGEENIVNTARENSEQIHGRLSEVEGQITDLGGNKDLSADERGNAERKIALDRIRGTSSLQKQAAQLGAAQADMDIAAGQVKQASISGSKMSNEERGALGKEILEQFTMAEQELESSGFAEKIEAQLSGISFDEIRKNIEEFANGGKVDLQELLSQIQQVQSAMEESDANGKEDYLNTQRDIVSHLSTTANNESLGEHDTEDFMSIDTSAIDDQEQATQIAARQTEIQESLDYEAALKTLEESNSQLAESSTRIEELKTKLSGLEEGSEEYKKTLEEINAEEERAKDIEANRGKAQKVVENGNKKQIKSSKELTKAGKKYLAQSNTQIKTEKKYAKALDGTLKSTKQQGKLTRQLEKEEKNLNKTKKKLTDNNERQKKSYLSLSQALSVGLNSALGTASGMKLLSNSIGDTIAKAKTGTGSFGDFFASISAGVGGVTQLISQFKQYRSVMDSIVGTITNFKKGAEEQQEALNATGQAAEINAELEQTAAAETAEGEVAASAEVIASTEGEMAIEAAETAQEVTSGPIEVAAAEGEAAGEVAADTTKKASKLGTIATNIAAQLSAGPGGWVTGAISAAMVAAAIGYSVISGISGSKKKEEQIENEKAMEANKASITNSTEKAKTSLNNVTALSGIEEQNDEVGKLIENYDKLKEAGEGVGEAYDEIVNSTEDLIESYKELNDTVSSENLKIDTGELEDALAYFKQTGDSSQLEEARENAEKQAKESETGEADNAIEQAKKARADALKNVDLELKQDGWTAGTSWYANNIDADKYTIEGGKALFNELSTTFEKKKAADSNYTYDDLLRDYADEISEAGLTNVMQGNSIKTGITNNTPEKIALAKENWENAWSTYADVYNETSDIIEQSADTLLNADTKATAEAATEGFGIDSVKDFEDNYDKMVSNLMTKFDASEEQAKEWIDNSDEFNAYSRASNMFGEDSTAKNLLEQNKKGLAEEIQEEYAKLPEEMRTLALGVDYSLVDSKESFQEQLQEQVEKADIQSAIDEALSMDEDLTPEAIENYAEALQETVPAFKDNKKAATESASINTKLEKGLEKTAEAWEDNVDIIKKGDKTSLKYAESIGNLQEALKGTFGIDVSKEFVENEENLKNLQKVMEGDTEALDELQKAAAKDYIVNMELKGTEETEDKLQGWRNELEQMMSEIDNSVKLGEDVTISDNYLATLQEMLDSGAMTKEQLDSMFNAAGITLKYELKEVDGPKETTTITTYNKDGEVSKEIIEKQTKMEVPNLSVDGKKVTDVSIKKASDSSTVSGEAIKEKSGQEAPEPKEAKTFKDEAERNYGLKKSIDSLTKEYDRLSTAKDRAYGKDKLKAIDQVTNSIDKQIAAQEQLINATQSDLLNDASILKGYGATFDANGNIANYDAIMQKEIDIYNANKDSQDEEVAEAAEKRFEEFKQAISDYEGSYEEYMSALDQMTQLEYDRLDNILEGIEYKVDFRVELRESDLKLIEHQLNMIEDDAFNGAKSISLMYKQAGANLQKADYYKEGITDILSSSGANQDQITRFMNGDVNAVSGLTFTESQMEKLQEYSDGLLDIDEELNEIHNSIHEQLLEDFEEQNEEFDKMSSKVEYLSSKTQNYRDIIDLVGKDKLNMDDSTLDVLNRTQMQASLTGIQVSKDQLEAQKAQQKIARDAYNEAVARGDKEAAEKWKDDLETITEAVQESELNVQENMKSALEQAANIFEDTVNRAAEAFDKAMGGVKDSLTELKKSYDFQKAETELYLQDYKKMYETSKLIRNINKSIDSTDNIKAQKELNGLAQEVAEYQKEGKQMSDYDLQYLQKKYDLMVAQQALEDAKDAKDMVRLQRNASGSYGYVYTANQDNIDQAEQKVEDAQYAMNDLNYQTEVKQTEKYFSLMQEWSDALKELKASDYETMEEYYAAVQEINDHYTKLVEGNTQVLEKVTINTGRKFSDTLLGQAYPDYKTFEELSDGTTGNIKTMSETLTTAWQTYNSNVSNVFTAAGTSVDTYKTTVNNDAIAIQKDLKDTGDKADDFKKTSVKAFNDSAWEVKVWEKTYDEKLKNAREDNDQLSSSITKLRENYSGEWDANVTTVNNAVNDIVTKLGEIPETVTTTIVTKHVDDWSGSTSTNPNQPEPNQQDPIDIVQKFVDKNKLREGDRARWGQAFTPEVLEAWRGLTQAQRNSITGYVEINKLVNTDALLTDLDRNNTREYKDKTLVSFTMNKQKVWIDQSDIRTNSRAPGPFIKEGTYIYKFAQGGLVPYTGPAWVDGTPSKPEAFLNPLQTELIGNLVQQLQLNAQTMKLNYSAPGFNREQLQNLQQEVTIHAEFPNATNHSEIEEAFNTLINRAGQFINQ